MLDQKLAGRYHIITQLGGGAFGATFIALDTLRPGNPECVVKQFKPRSTNPYTLREGKRLFDQEAKVLETLGHHDQIPQLLAHFEENQEFYLVQEFIGGHDLSQELPPLGKQLSEVMVIKLLQEILQVLAFVHERKVIHRDIKPSNIRRRQSDGKIVLIDFGAVKEVGMSVNQQGQTVETIAIGTPGYMASEQANSKPKFSSDVYAVGIIGIQALTGLDPVPRPHPHNSPGLPTDPKTGEIIWRDRVKVSPKLANILDKMVRYYFPQRYQSADEALQALSSLTKNNSLLLYQKIALALGLVAIIFLIAVVARPELRKILGLPTNSSSIDTAFLNYEIPSYRIKMKYPITWTIEKIGDEFTGDVAKFLSPLKSGSKIQAEVSVNIENIKQSMPLNEYTNSFLNEIKKYLTNPIIHESRPTTLANQPAHKVVYTGKQEQYNVKRMAVWTLKNNKAYIITYTAEESQYDDFFNTAQEMINSLEIQ